MSFWWHFVACAVGAALGMILVALVPWLWRLCTYGKWDCTVCRFVQYEGPRTPRCPGCSRWFTWRRAP